jgi:hypothetical protein
MGLKSFNPLTEAQRNEVVEFDQQLEALDRLQSIAQTSLATAQAKYNTDTSKISAERTRIVELKRNIRPLEMD